jgi:hypothetical protein
MKPRKPNPAQQQLELRDPGQPTLGEVCSWFQAEHVEGPDLGLVTQRGYRSTMGMALAHFGEDCVPGVGQCHKWLSDRLKRREVTALTANSHRDRMHAIYILFQKQKRAVTLNPWSFRRFKEDDRRHLRGSMDTPGKTWAAILAAMPDDRARAFVSLLGRLGWRKGDGLGVEWRHLLWKAPGGAAIRREQQRRVWEERPGELKHGGLVGTYTLHPETAEYLKRARRLVSSGAQLFGCKSGALVGTGSGRDGMVRQYVFPYREKHVDKLMALVRAAAPAEFPAGQAWHRLRRFATVIMVKSLGIEAAKRMRGDKYITTTQLYAEEVVGVSATGEDVQAFYAAQDRVLSDDGEASDNVEAVGTQQNRAVERSAI